MANSAGSGPLTGDGARGGNGPDALLAVWLGRVSQPLFAVVRFWLTAVAEALSRVVPDSNRRVILSIRHGQVLQAINSRQRRRRGATFKFKAAMLKSDRAKPNRTPNRLAMASLHRSGPDRPIPRLVDVARVFDLTQRKR